jgi:excisionase family DNA binding protein
VAGNSYRNTDEEFIPDSIQVYSAPGWLRTSEVAKILGVSHWTVARWAREGKLPFIMTLGGHRRYSETRMREIAASNVIVAHRWAKG